MTKDANQKKAAEELTPEMLDDQINREMANWQRAGIDPSGVNHVTLFLDCQLRTLINFLIEKEIVVEDEVNYAYKKELLDTLRKVRQDIAPAVARAKLTAGIELPPGVQG